MNKIKLFMYIRITNITINIIIEYMIPTIPDNSPTSEHAYITQ